MSTIINLGSSQIKSLSRILSRHLSRSSQGKEIINELRRDREQGPKSLLAYLDEQLPEDKELARKLEQALGKEHGTQFNTIVASGGSVGEIISIGQLDRLDIHYSVFSDVRQVVTLLLGVVIIGGTIAFGIWWSRQPRRMTGDFNIAVAEFVQTGEADSVAPIVSQRISSFLDGQYKLSSFETVEVAHNKIPVITSAEEARALAERINAHLVIYGDVAVVDNQVLITPQFYVIESHQSDVGEVNGEHKLAAPISLLKKDLVGDRNQEIESMKQRIRILTEFTKALVYLTAGTPEDLSLARVSIDCALDEGKTYGKFEGREVLYLIASRIARLQRDMEASLIFADAALDDNSSYARAFIAKANIYFELLDYPQALALYTQAAQIPDQPYGAYIVEKANLGMGNIYYCQYLSVRRNPLAQPSEIRDLAEVSLAHYQVVIGSFHNCKRPELRLTELAARSYYYSGIIYQEEEDFPQARSAYEQVLGLTQDTDLREDVQKRLDTLS